MGLGLSLSQSLSPAIGSSPLPPPPLPGWASVGEDVSSPPKPKCSRVGWYPRGGGQWGEGFIRVGWGGEEGVEAVDKVNKKYML